MVERVVRAISQEGSKQGIIDEKQSGLFASELFSLMCYQYASFNSPVWFNVGVFSEYGLKGGEGLFYFDSKTEETKQTKFAYERPQSAACFILEIEDDLMNIFDFAKSEARLFKFGSGSGANFSSLRGKNEFLSSGGKSSGLIPFLEFLDKAAGATKSGGITRRAAKMVCLDVNHPDIFDFVRWKKREEEKAKALLAAGFGDGMDSEAYRTVSGQNCNTSVRITEAFLQAVKRDESFPLVWRTRPEKIELISARKLWSEIAEAAWACADPGVQFEDEIQKWHTCSATEPIRASNPCSEFMFLNSSACHLASLNLVKFLNEKREFDVKAFRKAVRLLVIAQEILVGMSSYPTPKVAERSYSYRPIGLGYANLGALLMLLGLPYDSDQARHWCASITSLLCLEAYKASADLAAVKGPFADFEKNKNSLLGVLGRHRDKADELLGGLRPAQMDTPKATDDFASPNALNEWNQLIEQVSKTGVRHAQVTAIAPTGTIGLLMDCDTFGIEPEYAFSKRKHLSGGGELSLTNSLIYQSLLNLGYLPSESLRMVEEIKGGSHIENIRDLKPKHYPIFETAQPTSQGRFISASGHLKMMAAAQPFVSGAISKTINLPANTPAEDIEKIYFEAATLGLKAVALYRDQSKGMQPLNECPTCGT